MAKYKEGDFIVFNNDYATVVRIMMDSKNNEDLYELCYIKEQQGEYYWGIPIRWVDSASRWPTSMERLLFEQKERD